PRAAGRRRRLLLLGALRPLAAAGGSRLGHRAAQSAALGPTRRARVAGAPPREAGQRGSGHGPDARARLGPHRRRLAPLPGALVLRDVAGAAAPARAGAAAPATSR